MTHPATPPEHYDVFLSYQHADEEWVKGIAYRLRKAGLRVFHAPSEIGPGENFVARIDQALTSAKFFAIVLSPEALKADWPSAERAAAVLSDPAGRFGRVIPLLRRPCQLPPLLAFRNYIDFRDDSKLEIGLKRLISSVKREPLERGEVAAREGKTARGVTAPDVVDAVTPDDVSEEVFGNLFPVSHSPEQLWSAPTRFSKKEEVYRYFGSGRVVPAFILRENRLYTFVDLDRENNPFVGTVEPFDTRVHGSSDWLDDEDKSRWFMELLNDVVRSHCMGFGLSFDKIGKRQFFAKGILATERVAWTPHVRRGRKDLILTYASRDRPGEVGFYAHRAIALRFEILGRALFLRLESGWVFTFDGRTPLEGKRRAVLSTKFLRSQRNLRDFAEVRFWAWLLSSDGKTVKMDMGNGHLEVSTKPFSVPVRGGIFGDFVPLPESTEVPPSLFERDVGEEEEEPEEEVEDEDNEP